MLDQDAVLEDRDLGAIAELADGHGPIDRFAAGQELGLGEDGSAAAPRVPPLPPTLALGLQAGRPSDASHPVAAARPRRREPGSLARGRPCRADRPPIDLRPRRRIVSRAAAAAPLRRRDDVDVSASAVSGDSASLVGRARRLRPGSRPPVYCPAASAASVISSASRRPRPRRPRRRRRRAPVASRRRSREPLLASIGSIHGLRRLRGRRLGCSAGATARGVIHGTGLAVALVARRRRRGAGSGAFSRCDEQRRWARPSSRGWRRPRPRRRQRSEARGPRKGLRRRDGFGGDLLRRTSPGRPRRRDLCALTLPRFPRPAGYRGRSGVTVCARCAARGVRAGASSLPADSAPAAGWRRPTQATCRSGRIRAPRRCRPLSWPGCARGGFDRGCGGADAGAVRSGLSGSSIGSGLPFGLRARDAWASLRPHGGGVGGRTSVHARSLGRLTWRGRAAVLTTSLAANRSAASGSPTAPVSSSGPCATRIAW